MQHVEPCETTALCPCVSVPGGPAVLSERALQAVSMLSLSQRANLQTAAFSIRSGFWRCVFFFFSPHVPDEGEVGEWIRGDWEAGLQIKGEMCLALGGTAYSVYKQSLNSADFGFSGGGAPGRRSTRPVERNPIRAFS